MKYLFIISILASCSFVDKRSESDSLETISEEVIKSHKGVEIDITPKDSK